MKLVKYAALCAAAAVTVNMAGLAHTRAAETDVTLTPVGTVLSSYSCVKPASTATRRIGQVIDGVMNEWIETYSDTNNNLRIHCIHMTAPNTGALDAQQAADLLERSRRIGALTPNANSDRERSQEATGADIVDDMIKRAKPATPLRPKEATAEQMQSAQSTNTTTPDVSAPMVALPVPSEGGALRYNEFRWGIDGSGKSRMGRSSGQTGSEKQQSATETQKQQGANLELERAQVGAVDERSRVNNPLFPANIVGKVYSEYSDGAVTTCTATLVSQYVALTAGHCIHARDRNGYATRVVFVPQQLQSTFGGAVTRPFGFKFASAIAVSARWTQISGGSTILPTDSRHDYGVIYFSTAWTFTSTYAPIVYNYTGSTTFNFGYPGRVQDTDGNDGQWVDTGVENARSAITLRGFQVREFILDISGGNSGGPYFGWDGTNFFFSGIVSYGYADNGGGVWLGGTNESVFRSYAAWTPSSATPSRISSDVRAPLILTSIFDGGESYLRFFNNSPSAGTVTVRFYDLDGLDIGGWQSPSISPFASRQFTMAAIEQVSGLRIGNNEVVSARITATFTGLFQHVAWNVEGESLTNLTGCSNGLSSNISSAINVHSSLLEEVYPSYIVLHSLESQTSNISADVYDSVTGVRVGGVTITGVPGNASGVVSMSDIEDIMGFAPDSSQYHLNLVLSGNNAAYLQHQVENENSGVTTNFTSMCKL
jgi:V8-like Glu-specific endopeptidase